MDRTRGCVTVVVAAVFALVGCNSVDESGSAEAGEAPDQLAEERVDRGTDPEQFVAQRWLDMEVQHGDGSTYDLRLEIGDPVAADDRPVLDGFDPPVACSIDEERDLLIPARVLATSTTGGFTHDMSGFTVLATQGAWSRLDEDLPPHARAVADDRIRGANNYSSGGSCTGRGDLYHQLSGARFSDVTEGQRRAQDFWIVIHDYFSPAHPEGQYDILRGLGAQPVPQSPGPVPEITDVSGTGPVDGTVLPFVEDSLYYEAGGREATTGENCREDPRQMPSPTDAAFDDYPDMVINEEGTYIATLATTCGDLVIELDAAGAPLATNNFVFLAGEGYYEGTGFHRVIPDFLIQGGDPTGTGSGGPGYTFADELGVAEALVSDRGGYPHGTVAMANRGPDTNGSQFFVVLGDTIELGPDYTVFGELIAGRDVADRIGDIATEGDMAIDPVRILSVQIERR